MKSNIIIKYGVAALTIYSICLTYLFFFNNDNIFTNTDIVDDSDKRQDLYQRIIKYGDTIAYNHLIDNYGSPNNLIYSIYMADRYGYPIACQNVYTDLAGVLYAYHGIVCTADGGVPPYERQFLVYIPPARQYISLCGYLCCATEKTRNRCRSNGMHCTGRLLGIHSVRTGRNGNY